MKKDKKYLVKGAYSHPQISGYLTVKQFMIVDQDGKKCLLLRFFNEASFHIYSAEFMLKQLNSKGEVIDSSRVKCPDLKAWAGSMCALENGIVLKQECVDVIVKMISVEGEKYQYRFNNDTVTAHYNKRGYDTYGEESANRRSSQVVLSQKYSGGGKFHKGVAFLSLVLLLSSFCWIVVRSNMPERKKEEKSTGKSTSAYETMEDFSDVLATDTEIGTETGTETGTEIGTETGTGTEISTETETGTGTGTGTATEPVLTDKFFPLNPGS